MTTESSIRTALFRRCRSLLCGFFVLLGMAGCQTAPPDFTQFGPPPTDAIQLREGDIVRVTFPSAPALSAVQQVRRDGKITMSLVGEVTAAGLTLEELQKELLRLYSTNLVTKQVTVTVESSVYVVYVTGAILRPGRITSDRPITVLEAVMEAGGPDYTKANLKSVKVIRNNKGVMTHIPVNLRSILKGSEQETFYLKPFDIVFIPEKFKWW